MTCRLSDHDHTNIQNLNWFKRILLTSYKERELKIK